MEKLIKNELKQISLAQCIVNAIKPRSSIAPSRKVEKVFGSKWLITELNKLGFSISSNETTRYKQSVVCNENISDYLKDVMPGSFCQWSAGNVDHKISSIDGKGSLDAMGIIVSSTSSFSNDSANVKSVV